VRYNSRPLKLLQTESSFMHGSLHLGTFVVKYIAGFNSFFFVVTNTELEDNDVFIVLIEFI